MMKLPNISASISQLPGDVKELQSSLIPMLPNFPEEPADGAEAAIKTRYAPSATLNSIIDTMHFYLL